MTFVEFAYKKVYGIDSPELDVVRNKLVSLFDEYTLASMSTRGSGSASFPSSSGGGHTIIDTGNDIFTTNIIQVTYFFCFSVLHTVIFQFYSYYFSVLQLLFFLFCFIILFITLTLFIYLFCFKLYV